MIYLILILLLIILFFNFECFTNNNLTILSENELKNVLLNDTIDNYYKSFSKLDLQVRGVNSINEYKNKIKNLYYKTNYSDYYNLLNATNKADSLFKKYNIIGFDGNKAANIKWKIGIINDPLYESGLPHTRNDTIIIPNKLLKDNRLMSVLLHEKIHVYQKLYPNDINKYLVNNNFIKSRKKTNNIRANPDIDNYIYKHNGIEMYCQYNNNPSSILDVKYYPKNDIKNEHPFEYMAYTIESELV